VRNREICIFATRRADPATNHNVINPKIGDSCWLSQGGMTQEAANTRQARWVSPNWPREGESISAHVPAENLQAHFLVSLYWHGTQDGQADDSEHICSILHALLFISRRGPPISMAAVFHRIPTERRSFVGAR
jgi:hypothetical protein